MEPGDAEFSRVFKSFHIGAMRMLGRGSPVHPELKEIDAVWKSFLDWLKSEAGVYWISGIVGSGKNGLDEFVVLKSLHDGIKNRDSWEFLERHLKTLLDEIDALYADMWKRLNHDVYREAAAKYFLLAIATRKFRLGIEIGIPGALSVEAACRLMDIVQCAGLLVVRASQLTRDMAELEPERALCAPAFATVDFLHRAAYDFLVDTEAGKQVIGHSKMTLAQAGLAMLRAALAMVWFVNRNLGGYATCEEWLQALASLSSQEECNPSEIVATIRAAGKVYEKHYLEGFLHTRYGPRVPFLSLAIQIHNLDSFTGPLIEEATPAQATEILRAGWWFSRIWDNYIVPPQQQCRGFFWPALILMLPPTALWDSASISH
ncbi:hypothetical protein B0I35DRAFT_415348 [Stachybotrys elegans]|uniref:Uncharacterized protein n=1 Tax=Stachybotrys elegans TaxID=80388 RepID=A0A8K0WII7_9HYPO|nr:hypothetical protein B0I35DRAFT_415348 [Stachybotrys elegans]